MLENNRTKENFVKFYNDFVKSGKNPEEELQKQLNSKKISKEQLNQLVNKAKSFSWLLKLIK